MSEDFRADLALYLRENKNFAKETAALAVDEVFDRFMTLKQKAGDVYAKLIVAPPIIDEVWRGAVVHTQLYASYCKEKHGFFVHYDPVSKSFYRQLYHDTYAAYATMFGAPSGKFWPFVLCNKQDLPPWVRALPGFIDIDAPCSSEDEPEVTLQPRKKKSSTQSLLVEDMQGNTIHVNGLAKHDPVSAICDKLEKSLNIPVYQQCLFYGIIQLDKKLPIDFYNIHPELPIRLFREKSTMSCV